MSLLIQMKQRLKAIETIQKITHAMQLISMSAHLRLRDRNMKAVHYQQTLRALFFKAKSQMPSWDNAILHPKAAANERPLLVLIGSQKGLCGAFNTMLFYGFEKDLQTGRFDHADIITVGKKTSEYLAAQQKNLPLKLNHIASFDTLTSMTIPEIAHRLVQIIMSSAHPYSTVVSYSNFPIGFFSQRQQTQTIIPIEKPLPRYTANAALGMSGVEDSEHEVQLHEEYLWEGSSEHIMDVLAYQYLQSTWYSILIQSLLAEQAARFISMDNATRNAQKLRETMKLQYNKLRQAKITKELTELSGSFQQDSGA